MIDYDALGELEDWSHGWKAALNTDLSDVYVPGEGGDRVIAMVIGEAPGAQEEIKRRPFVGKAGIVLRQLMSFANLYTGQTPELGPANCWLTNTVKFRPPRNRTPTYEEIATGRYGLNMEWRAVGKPTLVIPVGGVALQAVLGKKVSILRHCGERLTRTGTQGTKVIVWPMLHPSYVLRSHSTKLQEEVEKDWERLGRWLYQRDLVGAHG